MKRQNILTITAWHMRVKVTSMRRLVWKFCHRQLPVFTLNYRVRIKHICEPFIASLYRLLLTSYMLIDVIRKTECRYHYIIIVVLDILTALSVIVLFSRLAFMATTDEDSG